MLGVFLVFACLFGGIAYSRYQRDWLAGISSLSHLLSQSVPAKEEKEVPKKETPVLTQDQITLRIGQIQKEILKTTNDPERDIELRTELYTLQSQLEN